MAGFAPIFQTVEVKLIAQRGGEDRINVIHYGYDSTRPTVAELQNLCNEVAGNIIDKYEDFVSLGTQWYAIEARDLHSAIGAQVSVAINRLSAGPIDDLPANVSYVLTKRSGQSGRSFRGRMYLIDLPEDFFNGSRLNPVYNSPISALAVHLLATRVSGRFWPAIASRKLGNRVPWLSVTHDSVADTQRRRLPGRGS